MQDPVRVISSRCTTDNFKFGEEKKKNWLWLYVVAGAVICDSFIARHADAGGVPSAEALY